MKNAQPATPALMEALHANNRLLGRRVGTEDVEAMIRQMAGQCFAKSDDNEAGLLRSLANGFRSTAEQLEKQRQQHNAEVVKPLEDQQPGWDWPDEIAEHQVAITYLRAQVEGMNEAIEWLLAQAASIYTSGTHDKLARLYRKLANEDVRELRAQRIKSISPSEKEMDDLIAAASQAS